MCHVNKLEVSLVTHTHAKVNLHKEVYDLQKSLACIAFLSKLYNFMVHIMTIELWGDVKSHTKILSRVADELESLYFTNKKSRSTQLEGYTLAGLSYCISAMKPFGVSA